MDPETEIHSTPNLTLRNRVAGLTLVLIGCFVVYEGQRYGLGHWSRFGAGTLPFGLGLLMAVLGVAIAVLNPDRGESAPVIRARPLLLVLAALLSFALLIDTAGLLAATAALVLLSGLADPESTLPSLCVIYVGIVVFVYLVFVRLLAIPFPLIGG